MKRLVLSLTVVSSVAACAGSGGVVPRSYRRGELESVPLRSVAVVAGVTPGVRPSSPRIEVSPFPSPASGAVDGGRDLDVEASAELARWTRKRLERVGFAVPTSSVADGSGLAAWRSDTEADAILVIRAVPLDDPVVYVDSGEAQVLSQGAEDTMVVPQRMSEERRLRGRVLLGQAFLFHAKTGARLWSRQLEGMPQDGQLRRGSKLLQLGVVADSASDSEAAVRSKASQAFVQGISEEFPVPTEGSARGSAAMAEVDVAAEARREAFLDAEHVQIEVATGWTLENIGASASADAGATALPDLGTGALAGSGGFQAVQLRGSYVTAGGLSFDGFAGWGSLLGSGVERTVYAQDALGNPVLERQVIEGGSMWGGGLGVGQLFLVGSDFFFHPKALAFAELWSYSTRPAGVLEDTDHSRLGAELRLDLGWVPFEGPLFFRIGAHARAGLDVAGPAFAGGGASVGVGALF